MKLVDKNDLFNQVNSEMQFNEMLLTDKDLFLDNLKIYLTDDKQTYVKTAKKCLKKLDNLIDKFKVGSDIQ